MDYDDDDSPEQNINLSQAKLYKTLNDSAKILTQNLLFNKGNKLLCRKLRFKKYNNTNK